MSSLNQFFKLEPLQLIKQRIFRFCKVYLQYGNCMVTGQRLPHGSRLKYDRTADKRHKENVGLLETIQIAFKDATFYVTLPFDHRLVYGQFS